MERAKRRFFEGKAKKRAQKILSVKVTKREVRGEVDSHDDKAVGKAAASHIQDKKAKMLKEKRAHDSKKKEIKITEALEKAQG